MISVVSPFYNEEAVLDASVRLMLTNLAQLQEEWEFIMVNDGSKDNSFAIAQALAQEFPRLRLVSYSPNRGRGYAIRQGIKAAQGEIVISTEIDSSWGDDIVLKLVEAFKHYPDADIIIASPHLPGGGYKNVPRKRVFLSQWGNYIIRLGMTFNITMNTGMTRGYKRDKFLALPLYEDEKEQHLEIINKALGFNYKIYEIPAILEWRDNKLTKNPQQKRKSSANIPKLIRTHLLFSIFTAPFRYLYGIAFLFEGLAAIFMLWAIINFFNPAPSIFLALTSFFLGLFGFLIIIMGVLGQQNRALQVELWRLQSELKRQNLD